MIKYLSKMMTGYFRDEDGVAATEAALTLPVLMILLAGVYDVGQAIVLNHKAVVAAQIMGDLITRKQIIEFAEIEDIAQAGTLAMEPYSAGVFGYDIASFIFDEDGDATEDWRVTSGMEENQNAITMAEELAEANEGLIVVTTTYNYTPLFGQHFINQIDLNEVALLRGRQSAIVTCSDCP